MLNSMTSCINLIFFLEAARFRKYRQFVTGAIKETAMNENDFDIFVVLRCLYQATYDPLPISSYGILSFQIPIRDLKTAWGSGPPRNPKLRLEALRQRWLHFCFTHDIIF